MSSQNSNGWPPSSGPGAPPPTSDHLQQHQRPLGSFGTNHPMQQGPPNQMGGPVLPPPPGSYYPNQANGHALPALTSLAQASPLQANRPPPLQQQSPPNSIHHQSQAPPPPQGPSYALPALGQAMQQSPPHPSTNLERERELREQEMRSIDEMHRREEMMHHERERELREQQRDLQQTPHENHTGSIPLQQPVASRIPSSLHGPNGILSHLNSATGPNPPTAGLGGPNGPGNTFTNGMVGEGGPRPFLQHPGQNLPPQQLASFNGTTTPQQYQGAVSSQQPILNDALSYLDQVKLRFVDHPDVYNRFLDIMKDFKSQAIDTPGVIERVSNLFTGHPELIQGFNTFLPPGYRIECGTRDDPNTIRVTTPMGTTVSQMTSIHPRLNDVPNGIAPDGPGSSGRQSYYENGSHAFNSSWQHQSQIENPQEANFSPSGRSGGLPIFSQHPNAPTSENVQYEIQDATDAAAFAHQQEQQGVSQLQNAVSVATNGAQGRHPMLEASPSSGSGVTLGQAVAGLGGVGPGGLSANQSAMEKRGPVEFNHAINYVNKIKQRFNSQPEIYKQFLEILQTYQRESKPIQDVYAQVTQLFNSAPDLLEDFKQFLPESAAQAKAQAAARQATEDAAMLSNVRGESSYLAGIQSSHTHTPKPEMKMPPVGNFAPPLSVGKENKKRRGGAGSQMTGGANTSVVPESSAATASQANRNGGIQPNNASKRPRIQPPKSAIPDMPAISPTLVPDLPQPIPPSTTSVGSTEDVAFFDRVRKHIANRSTFNEFLKLCNLFSQDLIDKNVLVHKASNFIGSNLELMTWFKNFVRYDGRDELIENRPAIGDAKVVLSNCRALGPSYRLLPKRERLRLCSGRDEMCLEVLNDEWASHPTWASEDSGFVAHRKNNFEESLHRIEEERHDYDFNIETCLRTIQLLEPVVQQLKLMSEEERGAFTLPVGLGGQSEAIYQRVIKKIYDRERGGRVIEDMFHRPAAVCPIVLARLKQKAEEWKASQREWEKVWREQTHKQFWRSLDHQGLNAKIENKRQFQPKALQTDIQTKYEEQRRQRMISWMNISKYQFEYFFNDVDVIQDACHILLTYLHHAHAGNAGDQSKTQTFFKTCIPAFFGLDKELFQQRMSDIYDVSPPNEEVEDDAPTAEDSNVGRGRRGVNGRKSNLLRGVLDRGQAGKSGRKDKESSAVSESKDTTPDPMSMDEDSATQMETPSEQPSHVDATEHRWMEHPSDGNARNKQSIKHNQPFKRDTFNLYANLNIYCFMRMFELLYERLLKIKMSEEQVHEDIRRAKAFKPAHELKLADKTPSDFFADTSLRANYYQQIVRMCEDIIKGEMDMNHLEDTLRRFYLQHGWQLYGFDKLLAAIIRFALNILVSDSKDKSSDIMNLFYKNRKESETTYQAEMDYRKQVEKLAKDGDIYRIAYNRSTQRVTIQIFKKEDRTFESEEIMTPEAKWDYYTSSYKMRDWTEGVPHNINWPFLRRNLAPKLDTEEEYQRVFLPQWNEDGLVIRVCANSYHLLYQQGTTDWWVHDKKVRSRGLKGLEEVKEERKSIFEEKFGMNTKWMAGMTKDEVDKINEDFRRWVNDGPAADTIVVGEAGSNVDGDKVMTSI